MTVSDGGTPLVAQEVRYYDICYHVGDQYYGSEGWRIIRCINFYTKEELFIYERL
jgi:hypothetical protein